MLFIFGCFLKSFVNHRSGPVDFLDSLGVFGLSGVIVFWFCVVTEFSCLETQKRLFHCSEV